MARILIVDDAAFMRTLLTDVLTSHGHEVIGEAACAKEGIEKFRALKPDLMTMDIEMPEESGINTLGAVQTITRENPAAKIVIVSSLSEHAIIKEMISAGACDFVVKPFEQEMLVKTIGRIVGGK